MLLPLGIGVIFPLSRNVCKILGKAVFGARDKVSRTCISRPQRNKKAKPYCKWKVVSRKGDKVRAEERWSQGKNYQETGKEPMEKC